MHFENKAAAYRAMSTIFQYHFYQRPIECNVLLGDNISAISGRNFSEDVFETMDYEPTRFSRLFFIVRMCVVTNAAIVIRTIWMIGSCSKTKAVRSMVPQSKEMVAIFTLIGIPLFSR